MLTPPRREWYYVGVEEHKTHSTGRVHTLAAVAVNKYSDIKSEMFVFFVLTAQGPGKPVAGGNSLLYFFVILARRGSALVWLNHN